MQTSFQFLVLFAAMIALVQASSQLGSGDNAELDCTWSKEENKHCPNLVNGGRNVCDSVDGCQSLCENWATDVKNPYPNTTCHGFKVSKNPVSNQANGFGEVGLCTDKGVASLVSSNDFTTHVGCRQLDCTWSKEENKHCPNLVNGGRNVCDSVDGCQSLCENWATDAKNPNKGTTCHGFKVSKNPDQKQANGFGEISLCTDKGVASLVSSDSFTTHVGCPAAAAKGDGIVTLKTSAASELIPANSKMFKMDDVSNIAKGDVLTFAAGEKTEETGTVELVVHCDRVHFNCDRTRRAATPGTVTLKEALKYEHAAGTVITWTPAAVTKSSAVTTTVGVGIFAIVAALF